MIKAADLIISICYMLGILAVGLWSGIRHRRKNRANAARGYFLAGKTLRWPAIRVGIIRYEYFNRSPRQPCPKRL